MAPSRDFWWGLRTLGLVLDYRSLWKEVVRRMRMSLRIGPGPPGVLAAVAAGDPKSGVLASSSSPLLHTGSTEIKEGGRKNATAVRRLRRRRPMKEMLTARIYIGRERRCLEQQQ